MHSWWLLEKGLYCNTVQEHHDSFPLSLGDCQDWRVSFPYDQHHVFCRQKKGFSHTALTIKASSFTYQSHTEHVNTQLKAKVLDMRTMNQKYKQS